MDMYPLIFKPILKPKIWGGRTLERILAKELPEGEKIGESWELADLEDDQSVVANGAAKGKTLGELVKEWGTDLVGHAPLFEGRFPLLIKFLDACDTLSVQVHPNEAAANRLGPRVRLKNEAWYIIAAEEDGCIYRGVKPGVDAGLLRQAIDNGTVESLLNRIKVRKGHCYYLPSGTIHALGANVTVAEVQTPSDTTFRVFDWNRLDEKSGQPRELHIEQALECISFETGPIPGEQPRHVATVWAAVSNLVRCDSFMIDRVRMIPGVDQPITCGEMLVWVVLEGRAEIVYEGAPAPVSVGVGDTLLLPAGLSNGRVLTQDPCMWLEVAVPIPSPLSGFERPDLSELRRAGDGPGFVQLNVPDQD